MLSVYATLPASELGVDAAAQFAKYHSPLKPWVATPGKWESNPIDALWRSADANSLKGLVGVFCIVVLLFAFATNRMGRSAIAFAKGFLGVFTLAVVAFVMSGQAVVAHYGLGYALWALVVGLVISNTIGTPEFIKPAARTEFFVKTGLVLLGAGILFNKLLALGVPGICVAWIVTPIVLIATYLFGQRVLKIESPTLNIVIAADMSVCGVSAAIATAAACRAKKEELTLAVGLSMTFTVVMMVALPIVIRFVGIDEIIGGAWIGGTIDATGAVVAAGNALGERAEKVAATVKMIQNILIGVTAFGVAVYWATRVDRSASGARPGVMEIWRRFPKFIIGFVAASIVFSIIYNSFPNGERLVGATVTDVAKSLREWLFCLAFVSIGLETNFRKLLPYLKDGKPLALYLCGQSLNLVLTLLMAWLMFGVVFKDRVDEVLGVIAK